MHYVEDEIFAYPDQMWKRRLEIKIFHSASAINYNLTFVPQCETVLVFDSSLCSISVEMHQLLDTLEANGLTKEQKEILASMLKFEISVQQVPDKIFHTEDDAMLSEITNYGGSSTSSCVSTVSSSYDFQSTDDARIDPDYKKRYEMLRKGLLSEAHEFAHSAANVLRIRPGDTPSKIEAKLDVMERIQRWMKSLRQTMIEAIKTALEWVKNKVVDATKKVKEIFNKIFRKFFTDDSWCLTENSSFNCEILFTHILRGTWRISSKKLFMFIMQNDIASFFTIKNDTLKLIRTDCNLNS